MAREVVWRWTIFFLFVAGCSDRRHDENDENVGSLSHTLLTGSEAEPNGGVTQATPLAVPKDVVIGNIVPSGDVDYYSFTGNAGDRVYAATQTATSPNAEPDSVLTLLGTDGTNAIETDDDNGWFTIQSSSIAGAVLPAAGTYYFRVSHFNPLLELRPYRLHFQKRSGLPQSEIESNDVDPQRLNAVAGAGAWVAGSIASGADVDYYFLDLNAGDTIFASLDTDPERDGTDFNATLGAGLFPAYFWTNNAGMEDAPDSEALFATVQAAGTYGVRVASGAASAAGSYLLSITAHPATGSAGCTTYTSTTTVVIPFGPETVTTTLNVPDDIVIGDVNVDIDLQHVSPNDLDVHLISPAGGRTGLFTDVGNASWPVFSFTLDDEAGIPIHLTPMVQGMRVQPEPAYRLSWFDGERAQGTWTLEIRDDQASNDGKLRSWGIRVCPAAAAPSCQAGYVPRVVYSTDFETNDDGFTHSGVADEWARGTPSAEPITTCNSGTQCFKTDLAGTYEASSNQNLVSPPIDLAEFAGPLRVRWAQKLQMDNATTDHAWVEVRNVDDTNPRRMYEFLDGNMTDSVGEPPVTVNESAGWSIREVDISEYAGESIELVFHVDSDAMTNLAGLAIDDVRVTACEMEAGGGGSGGGDGLGGTGGGGAGGAGAGAGGASGGGGAGTGGVAGASGAGTGGLSGTAGRDGMGGVAGSSGTSAGEGGDAGETGSGGNAGATGGAAGEPGSGGDSGATGGEAGEATGGAAGTPSDAGAGGDSDETKRGGGHADEDNGCGCRVAGKHERFGSWLLVGLAVGAVSVRRRRRRDGPVTNMA